jgi:hypothetical protein
LAGRTTGDNHRWHYALDIGRAPGGINPPMVSIRFPYTDLGAVVDRLRAELADQAAYLVSRQATGRE